jgi:hypothetical protein
MAAAAGAGFEAPMVVARGWPDDEVARHAVASGNILLLGASIEKDRMGGGSCVDARDPVTGATLLHQAILACKPEIVAELVKKEASFDIKDAAGDTPVHAACRAVRTSGGRACFEALLLSSAYPDLVQYEKMKKLLTEKLVFETDNPKELASFRLLLQPLFKFLCALPPASFDVNKAGLAPSAIFKAEMEECIRKEFSPCLFMSFMSALRTPSSNWQRILSEVEASAQPELKKRAEAALSTAVKITRGRIEFHVGLDP